jgi:uncharacterized protein (DUF736 family)
VYFVVVLRERDELDAPDFRIAITSALVTDGHRHRY